MTSRRRNRVRDLSGWALAGVAGCAAFVPTTLPAQTAAQAAPAQRDFDVPAQPLSRAALRFSDQAGLQLMIESEVAEGLQGNAVRGRYTVEDALGRLLAGTGLTWRYLSARVVTIERGATAAASDIEAPATGDRVFGAVNIQGQQSTAENGFAALDGFGRGAGSNGSSDVAATEGTGSLTTNGTVVASRLPQTLQETTQQVSVLTQERLKQQNITNLNEALNFTPGITVRQSNGTDNTFLSRGFQIDTFSVDGGAPFQFINNAQGSIELSQYDRVEVLRGSASQYGSAGNPGGTISLVRKRPLDRFQLNLEAGAGSYDDYRGEYDVTGPIGFDDHLRARFVLSARDRDFFYDAAHQTRGSAYGVFEADLGTRTIVRAGGNYQKQRDTAINLRGVPRFANGDELPLPRSTNFSAPFAEQEIDTTELFAALEHRFSKGWGIQLDATRRRVEGESLFVALLPGQIFASTVNPTISGTATRATSTNKQLALSATLSGEFEVFGLKQNIVAGYQYSEFDLDSLGLVYNRPRYVGRVFDFNRNIFAVRPGPAAAPSTTGDVGSSNISRGTSQLHGAYLTIDLNPTARLHLTGGVRYNDLSRVNDIRFVFPTFGFGGPVPTEETNTSFNGSVSYDIKPWLAAYVSYNDIFNPQTTFLAPDLSGLSPARGQTIEGGLRFRMRDGKLNGSVAYYDTRVNDLSFQVDNPTNTPNCCFTQIAVDKSRGVDIELAGQLTAGWHIQASYNYNDNDRFGNPLANQPGAINTEQPKHQARLFTVYDLPGDLKRLTVGVGARLESERSTSGTACLTFNAAGTGCAPGSANQFFSFRQPTYAVGDAFLRYRFTDNAVLALNVTNFTNARYFSQTGSVLQNNFYGEPRQVALSIRTSIGDRR